MKKITKTTKIYIAGHRGMVGSACWRALEAKGYSRLIGKTSKELDLKNQAAVTAFFKSEQPEVVIDAAAKVGGILANNNYPYPFLMENMQIQNNLIAAAHEEERSKIYLFGELLHLSKICTPTPQRGIPLNGQLGTDKRMVRACQDIGGQTL